MISIETAGKYFNEHLLGEFFLECGGTLSNSALRMAENDVISETIEGLGSFTYSGNERIFAPRTEIFIESINKRCRAAASKINITRG